MTVDDESQLAEFYRCWQNWTDDQRAAFRSAVEGAIPNPETESGPTVIFLGPDKHGRKFSAEVRSLRDALHRWERREHARGRPKNPEDT